MSQPVVFLAQWLSTFEMHAPVWRELRRRGVRLEIVVTPERVFEDRRPLVGGEYDHASARVLWAKLSDEGFAPLPLLPPEAEAARLRALDAALVLLPSPYDALRHADLAPDRLGIPVHFLNYGFRIESPDQATDNPFFDHCAAMYMENEIERDLFVAAGLNPERLVVTGHPVLDVWDQPHELAPRPLVLWCPWWGSEWEDGSAGYSTFFIGREAMLAEIRRRPHIDFVLRPHPLLWMQLLREERWSVDDEREFRRMVEAMPNLTIAEPDSTDHIAQFGSAWAMVTDGVSFLAEFSYTGKPLLLTELPGNPGWNAAGQGIRDLVDVSEVMTGLPVFLDRVEHGVDPVEVRAKQEAVRALFFRPTGGAAAAVADQLVKARDEELRMRAEVATAQRITPPDRLPEAVFEAVKRLNASDSTSSMREYQRQLLQTGALDWLVTRRRAVTVPLSATVAGDALIATYDSDVPHLLTGQVSTGWAIDRAVIGDVVYWASGEHAGARAGELRDAVGAGLAHRLATIGSPRADGPRSVRLGTTSVWNDLWNQLPAVVNAERVLSDLVGTGEVSVGLHPAGRAQFDSLGHLDQLLPLLAPVASAVLRPVAPVGTVPVGSVCLSTEARQRVRNSLAAEPVPPASGPRLWLGVSGHDAPVNSVDMLARLAASWHTATGGDVVIDAFTPDEGERAQWWRAAEIESADAFRADVARAIHVTMSAVPLHTTSGLSLRSALAWAGTADYYVCTPGAMVQKVSWLWDVPGSMVIGPRQHREAIAAWFATQVEGGIAAVPIPVEVVSDGNPALANDSEPYSVTDMPWLVRAIIDRAETSVNRSRHRQ
ncbi:MAG: hypothetical protein NTZ03_15755 [Actinobacteria bacterium]|nr:hypothetical protein [Actinomycetota bacterium]